MAFPLPKDALDDRLAGLDFRDQVIRVRDELYEPTKLDCAYAAGFFDGEGTVNISRTTRPDCVDPVYVLNAVMAQVVIDPLIFVQNRWGGNICRRPAKPPRQAYFAWQCHAGVASEFIFDMLPHLTVKRERAILGIRFQALKGGQGQSRGDRERAPVFEQFYAEMRALNGNAPNPWTFT